MSRAPVRIPEGARWRLRSLPPDFVDTGCSNAPDVLFHRITWCCRLHDAAYCTRLWPPGSMTQARREKADDQLRKDLRAALPWGLRWVRWLYWSAVWRWGGFRAWDSCGVEAGPRCRHNIALPAWMR